MMRKLNLERRGHPMSRFQKTFLLLTLLSTLLVFPRTEAWSQKSRLSSPNPGIEINTDVLTGIELLYNEKFDAAEGVFRKVTADLPEKPIGYFYLAMVTWSRLASGFWSSKTVTEYRQRIDRTIEVAESRIANGSDDHFDFFYLGGALGFKGRFELMKGHWFSSFSLALKAVDALETALKMNPANRDVLFGLGIFDYYTARLSGVLRFLSYLFFHRGDKKEGLRKLHLAAREAIYSATEAKSMLIHIYLFLEDEFLKALALAEELEKKYPDNPRYGTLKGVCCVRLGMDPEYRRTVFLLRQKSTQASAPHEDDIWLRRALYLEAIYALYHADYPQARTTLKAILNDPDPLKDPAMIAWPLVKIGMSYDLEGRRSKALEYYQRVAEMENGAGAQFLVKKLLQTPPNPDDPFIGY
jgi:tetratricopeptide (TPR) repeat protein